MAHVVVRDRNGTVRQKATLEKAVVIGRSAECAIRVRDTQVSREHCDLVPTAEGWVIRDRESKNGTYVNGKSVREHHLRDGDVIAVGSERIGFFATSSRRARAADPVLAGLVDAESATGRPQVSWEAAGLPSTESSLYATRVMVAASDESTVAGAQGVLQNRVMVDANPPPATVEVREGRRAAKTVGRMWGTVVGALGLVGISIAVWLYWG